MRFYVRMILCIFAMVNTAIKAADFEKIEIAVDIGGPTLRLEPDQEGKLTKGVIESLKILKQHYKVYFLSYCGEKMEMKTRENLRAHGVDSIIPEAQWIFVRSRPDKAKIMLERNTRLLIDDDRRGQIKDAVETAGLQFVLFNLDSEHPWKDVFIELQKTSQISGYTHALPRFDDGIPVVD